MKKKISSAVSNEHHSSEHCLIKGNNDITKNKNYNRRLTSFFIRETFRKQDFFFTWNESELIFRANFTAVLQKLAKNSTFADRKKSMLA